MSVNWRRLDQKRRIVFLDVLFPLQPGLFFGTRLHSQCLDVSFAVFLLIEKMMVCKSQEAMGEVDITPFPGSFTVLRVV